MSGARDRAVASYPLSDHLLIGSFISICAVGISDLLIKFNISTCAQSKMGEELCIVEASVEICSMGSRSRVSSSNPGMKPSNLKMPPGGGTCVCGWYVTASKGLSVRGSNAAASSTSMSASRAAPTPMAGFGMGTSSLEMEKVKKK